MSEWISVKDQLPPNDDEVDGYSVDVLATDGKRVSVGYIMWKWNKKDSLDWYVECNDMEEINITHWMPLPELPALKAECDSKYSLASKTGSAKQTAFLRKENMITLKDEVKKLYTLAESVCPPYEYENNHFLLTRAVAEYLVESWKGESSND